jgi:hypothetical protein
VTGEGATAAAQGRQPSVTGNIATVAGGVGGPAKATEVSLANSAGGTSSGTGDSPCGVSYAGSLYIADGVAARQVNPQTDWLTTPAGIGVIDNNGPTGGDGGPGAAAALNNSCGVMRDHVGNVVIADSDSGMIRVVAHKTGRYYGQAMTAGDIYDVAGGGSLGSQNGVLATNAAIHNPQGVTVDGAGNLVIADTNDNLVRVVASTTGTYYGRAMKAWHIYTVAGGGTNGLGDGGPAIKAVLHGPNNVAVDAEGNLVIAEQWSERIRMVAEKSGTFYGQAMTAGDIYTIAGNGTQGYSGDGGPAAAAELNYPMGVAVDGSGNVAVADSGNNRVRVIAAATGTHYGQAMTAGDIYSIAGNGIQGSSGDGGPAAAAELDSPQGVAVDSAGNLAIADTNNGLVRVVAAATGSYYARMMTAGDVYTIAGNGIAQYSGNKIPATSAELNEPYGAAVDTAGNLLIADAGNGRVRVVAHTTGTFYGHAMKSGNIYTVAGGGTNDPGNGGPGTAAVLGFPEGAAADHHGNLVIADAGGNRIRVVAGQSGTYYGQAMIAGNIYTIAGTGLPGWGGDGVLATGSDLYSPGGVAVDSAGNVVIADTGNDLIRVIAATTSTHYGQAMTAGYIYTVAGGGTGEGDGGPATSAGLVQPGGVAVDFTGNLVIADTQRSLIRVVAISSGKFYGRSMTAGYIYAVAGGGSGALGDGGPATQATISWTGGVAVDSAGNLLIADTNNGRIRVVAVKSATYYGQAMTAEDIYTVAGGGSATGLGDGGPATAAWFNYPLGVTATSPGNLAIADTYNNRIRGVTG